MVITDEMLYQNAARARDIWLDTLPSKSEIPEYVCSEHFEQQMGELLQQQRHTPKTRQSLCENTKSGQRHRGLRQVAAIFSAILLMGSIVILSSPTARATVFNWVREVFADHEVFLFDGGHNQSSVIPNYQPAWLPDGFTVMERYHDAGTCGAFYLNKVTGDSFSYGCIFMENASASITVHDYYTSEAVAIDGIEGWYYSEGEHSKGRSVIWVDETRNVVFSVDSTLDKETILHIARSISIEKK